MGRTFRRAALIAALAAALAACTSRRADAPPPTLAHQTPSHAAVPTAVGRPGCHPPSNVRGISGLPELHGAGAGIEMWGQVQTVQPATTLRVHEDVKIVWRITGRGPLHLASIDPSGRTHPLRWGPEPHRSSNYGRPGQEWGAGYRFGVAGCWTLRAVRGHAAVAAWVRVTE